MHLDRGPRKDRRKGFTEADYARLLDGAHQQLHGPIVLVWDNLPTHTSRAMRQLIAARSWLTVFQLPAYAPELNPVEVGGYDRVKRHECLAAAFRADPHMSLTAGLRLAVRWGLCP